MQAFTLSVTVILYLQITCFTQAAYPSTRRTNECVERTTINGKTPCTSCSISGLLRVPRGFRKTSTGMGNQDCSYTVDLGGGTLALPGCSHTIEKKIIEQKCCKGFWSNRCFECPGGADKPCSGRGTCIDGLMGNGTCICQEKFGGFVCQECADENAYGQDCASTCNCVHGVCNSGITGDGSCICELGYAGPKCDQESTLCKLLNCGANSHCVEWLGRTATCECMPGDQKIGNTCKARNNSCTFGSCDRNAICTQVNPRKYKCSCKTGYQGDGKICIPINPCTINNGGCHDTAVCNYKSPGKSYCSCKPGMRTTNIKAGCTVIVSPCGKFTCDKSARCIQQTNGTSLCVCKKGQLSDGYRCYGNIMEELQKLNEGRRRGKLTKAIKMFEEGCSLTLRRYGAFTVFVPIDIEREISKMTAERVCKLHIVPGEHLEKEIMLSKALWTLTGEMLEINKIVITLETQPKGYHLLEKISAPAANGIIHLIDSLIYRDSLDEDSLSDVQKTVGNIIAETEMFNRFQMLLEQSESITDVLYRSDPITVFVPSNDAVEKLRDGTLFYLLTDGKHKLQELVKYHIYTTAKVTVDKLITMPRLLTMGNQIINVNITSDGRVFLGDAGVPLDKRDIITSNGVIHTLDGILIPPSIIPLLPRNCDKKSYEVITGACIDCDALSNTTCPSGSTDMGTFQKSCYYVQLVAGMLLNRRGCAKYCNQTIVKRQCCKGFYGPDCKACPGGFQSPCYSFGKCSDGITGNGTCSCDKPFKGIACHICSNPNKHGETCDEDCLCVHGTCDNRPGSQGVCRTGSCKEGFAGQFCDRKAVPCGASGLSEYCHIHALCDYGDNGTRCICIDGYEGDGLSCQPVNSCEKPERGGCSKNARCINYSPGNTTCLCNPGWTGDGQDCVEIDNCLLETRGSCHADAQCISTGPGESTCLCKRNYVGDGYDCDPVNPCLEDNGGCYSMADCVPDGQGGQKCICPEDYGGDGIICFGDILTELRANSDFAEFYDWVQKSSISIPEGSNVTVLVPSATAIRSLSKEETEFWLQEPSRLRSLVKAHFLGMSLPIDELKKYQNQKVATFGLSDMWNVESKNEVVTIQNATVIVADIPAVNGIIHIIDKILRPSKGFAPSITLQQSLENISLFPAFKQHLLQYQLLDELDSLRREFTVLAPEDNAIQEFCNTSSIQQLDIDTVKYHIILGQKLRQEEFRNGFHYRTMLGASYRITAYSRDNTSYVNEVPVNGTAYETFYGTFIGIPQVLPVRKNQCDINETRIVKGQCSSCSGKPKCPDGTSAVNIPVELRISNCKYKIKKKVKKQNGCRAVCLKVIITPRCCPGYFGAECLLCPGKVGSPCFGNGICQDGINGTGGCECQEGFHGTACETCEAGRYGSKCKSECKCAHGKCNDGINGDGSCDCYQGWKGTNCDVEIVSDLCNGTCHPNANCIPGSSGSAPTCSCSAGYTGNGTYCSEINPCDVDNGGCSKFANCSKIHPGERSCSCWEGYEGDGLLCLEINGCLKYNGGCHISAECTKVGPNQVACNCPPDHSGDGITFCKPNNPCREANGGCSPFATCKFSGKGTQNCTCRRDYVGDGLTCRGKIFTELAREHEAVWFYRKLQKYNIKELNGKGPFTVFVPHQDSINPNITSELRNKSLTELLHYHIVGCQQLLLMDLQSESSLVTLAGVRVQISVKENFVYLNNDAKIIKSDFVSSNGVFHYIDKVLVSDDLRNNTDLLFQLQNITDVAKRNGYTIFSKLLKDVNLLSMVSEAIHRPFTMLWPTDEVFNSLSAERQNWLYSGDNRDKLAAYLKVLMIRDMKIVAGNLPSVGEVRTMHGSTISFTCSRTNIGDIMVDNGNARIVQRHIEFDGGIAYGIDQLLEPPNLGARCDEFNKNLIPARCGSCLYIPSCPLGTTEVGRPKSCSFFNYRPSSYSLWFHRRFQWGSLWPYRVPRLRTGCQRECAFIFWDPRCCKNHFGTDCQVCPGGLEAPCSNHGTCNDGKAGTGKCNCMMGFNGTACELCVPGRYGPDCKACNCTEHGQCDDGVEGEGACFCDEGWTGESCETKLVVKPVCSPKCDSHAVCRVNNTCECEPFYEGDGSSCTVVDRCQGDNGGCHMHATCNQTGVDVTCTCLADYEGDGYICTPIDRCADGRNGGCSEHATCNNIGPNKRRCECKDGYVGGGIQCLEKAIPPTDRCLEMNGYCHSEAICMDLHFQEKTAGVFHLQSPKGKYQFTYEDAQRACEAEGASLATFKQLSDAQQMGLHLCSISWMDNKTAGYPTTYANPNCGLNHVGIIDYGVRLNLSERWDAFCYRMKDVQCDCRDGYVGDGYYCNGNLLQVLASNSNFSVFYSRLLDYANSDSKGSEYLDLLSNDTTFETLFVPANSGFGENETVSWRDIEHHISMNDSLLFYLNLTDGTVIPSRLGYQLSIAESASVNRTVPPGSKLVNDKLILKWDILAFNGIIHVIEGPLKAPPPLLVISAPSSSPSKALEVTSFIGVAFLLIAVVGVYYYFTKRRNNDFQFRYFKGLEEDEPPISRGKSSLISVPNPVYGDNSIFSEPFEDLDNNQDFSDTQQILQD
nr:PREDICTED: stabilin-1 [Latimeria chalumnae]|eukprot:XP_014344303.1 PREDICTED: stabilin-1 [Latimeria chalumnae]